MARRYNEYIFFSLQSVVNLVRLEALQGRFPMNLPLEIRFAGDSNSYMSPATTAFENYGSGQSK